MKKINIFPKTVIQTNGVHPYVLKTVTRDNSLKLIEIESKDDSAINVDLSDIVFDGVAIKAYSELGETTLRWVRQCRSTQNFVTVQNRPLECDDDLKVEYMSELEFLVSKGYTIAGVYAYEIYYDAAQWASQTDTNSLSTDGKVETQTGDYFYKYRLRRKDGQPIDPTLLANLEVYVKESYDYYNISQYQMAHGWIEGTGYDSVDIDVRLNESVSTEGVVNLSFICGYGSHLVDDRYSQITGFLRTQIRDRRNNVIIAEYNVLIDTARQNVIDTLTLSGPASITSTTPAVYTLSKTWVNNSAHKYEKLIIDIDGLSWRAPVSHSWIVPGETFQITVSQPYTIHNVTLRVYDNYQDVLHSESCRSNTLIIDIDVPSGPSNLKFDPLNWTDVTSVWTLPAGLSNFSTLTNMGYSMWTDNEGNYYYERASSYPVYKIDFENKSITEMTGWTRRSPSLFWRIGDTVLYDTSSVWYPNNTTSSVTWMGEYPPSVAYIWTDGEHIYWTAPDGTSGVLTYFDYDPNMGYYGSWDSVTFTYTPSNFDPKYVWTDGERVYYSRGSSYQYVLDKANRDWQISVIDFQGYTLSDPTLQLFTDGVDIYMNSSDTLLKYDKDMWTFEVVSYPFDYKGPANMISKFMVCPSCRYKGLPSAIGNINPNTDDIYNRVSDTRVMTMIKIEVE